MARLLTPTTIMMPTRAMPTTAGTSGHAGHGDHVGQFRRLFWIMLVLAVPVVAL